MLEKFRIKMKNVTKLFNRRKNKNAASTIFEIKDQMADDFSAYKQLEYCYPKEIADWIKNGSKRFRDIFVNTNADEYNSRMVDELVDKSVNLAITSIDDQHMRHISAIKGIELAQQSRIDMLEKKIGNYASEIAELREQYPDIPFTEASHMGRVQNSRMPFYKKSWCLFLILGLSCLLDYTTISSAVDSLLTQNVFLSILLSLGTAMLINVTPSIAGVYAKNKAAENRRIILLMLGGIFFVLFIILCFLRWSTREMLFTDTSQLFATAAAVETNTAAQIVMTIFLSAEPALTSGLSFVFGYIGATKEEKERDLAEIHLAELHEMKDVYEVRLGELRKVVDAGQNMINEEEAYKMQLELMEKYRANFKELARMELSQLVARPNGNGIILQRENAVLFNV